MKQQQKAISLAYHPASQVKIATFFHPYAGPPPRHGFQPLFKLGGSVGKAQPVVAGILVCNPYPSIAASLSSEALGISLLETTNSISQCGHFSLDPNEIAGNVIKRLQYEQRI